MELHTLTAVITSDIQVQIRFYIAFVFPFTQHKYPRKVSKKKQGAMDLLLCPQPNHHNSAMPYKHTYPILLLKPRTMHINKVYIMYTLKYRGGNTSPAS